jgi:hypothetical protein
VDEIDYISAGVTPAKLTARTQRIGSEKKGYRMQSTFSFVRAKEKLARIFACGLGSIAELEGFGSEAGIFASKPGATRRVQSFRPATPDCLSGLRSRVLTALLAGAGAQTPSEMTLSSSSVRKPIYLSIAKTSMRWPPPGAVAPITSRQSESPAGLAQECRWNVFRGSKARRDVRFACDSPLQKAVVAPSPVVIVHKQAAIGHTLD